MSTDDKYHCSAIVLKVGDSRSLLAFSSTRNAELLPFGLSDKTLSAVLPNRDGSDLALEQQTDEALLARVRDDSREAIAVLFRRHAKAIRAVGKRILRDAGEAEDLVQEVFLYIFQKCDLYDFAKGSARSWIFQVAYTQAFIRRRRLVSQGVGASGIADKASHIQVGVSSSAETLEGLLGRSRWQQGIESLSDVQRETLRLHFFEGYTFAEIAERLGQSYANIRNHHYRGLEKLRKCLAENPLNRR